MADFPQNFGVAFVIVRNLLNQEQFLSWFPSAGGWGRWIDGATELRFHGNIFESIAGHPGALRELQQDLLDGRVAVWVCGEDTGVYEGLTASAVQFTCVEPPEESSSSYEEPPEGG